MITKCYLFVGIKNVELDKEEPIILGADYKILDATPEIDLPESEWTKIIFEALEKENEKYEDYEYIVAIRALYDEENDEFIKGYCSDELLSYDGKYEWDCSEWDTGQVASAAMNWSLYGEIVKF